MTFLARRESEFLLYQTEDGRTRVEVRFDGDTAWLSLGQMAELFQRDKSVISRHIKNVFEEGELSPAATVANSATVQLEGGREVTREVEYFNLDVIISVGYRVKSHRGTQFRIWATQRLREYIVKGFALDDERLKRGGGGNYFDELLARIRCATRDKFGIGTCSARALPATAIEEFVVQRIAEESLRGELAADVNRTLTARIEKRRAEATELRAQLPERIATAADHAKRLTEQSLRLNGRARELVEAQLVVESNRLVAAERQLAEATADLEALDAAQAEAEWLVGTLRDFARVWQLLTPENQGRLLRVLVAEIRVDEDQALLEVELIDFARQGAREAA